MKLGVDIDDVMAVCAVPYLRRFAQHFGVKLPDESELGWHLLDRMDEDVTPEQRDRFRIELYDGAFFGQLDLYPECPLVLDRLVAAGHELNFVTARAERRRVITETWLREKDVLRYAKAVHLKPHGDFVPTVRGRYDATGSATYKLRVVRDVGLDAFCEDDVVIAKVLADAGVRVFLFDQPWNRELSGECITRVSGWEQLASELGV